MKEMNQEDRADRADRAMNEKMQVVVLGAGLYEVYSQKSGSHYRVDLDAGTCTCPDYQHRRTNCKHKRRVAMMVNMGEISSPEEMETPSISQLEREVSNRLAILDKLDEE